MNSNTTKNIKFLYITIFITGAAILIIEIAGARVLSPFYGSTIFVWSSLIAVTLGFLALGYFFGGRIVDKHPNAYWFYSFIFVGGITALLLIKLSYFIIPVTTLLGLRTGAFVAALFLFAVPLFFLSTAGPFVIRLLSYDTSRTGHVSGSVFGISTAGSLFGALLTGFYLVPNFSISAIFTFTTLVVLAFAMAGLLLERRAASEMSVFILIAIVVFIFPTSVAAVGDDNIKLIHKEPSFYGEITVFEINGIRCLSTGSLLQSCIRATDGAQVSQYADVIKTIIQKSSGNMLVLGLGGGTIPRDLEKQFTKIDVVEIDKKVHETAREYFGYDDTGSTITTHIEGARVFLGNNQDEYDVIVLDVFAGSGIAPHLFTKEAFIEMKNQLVPSGMLVVNTIGRANGAGDVLTKSVFKTLQSVFAHVSAVSTENIKEEPDAFGNIIFIASNEEKELSITDEFVVSYNESQLVDAQLVTDEYNPLETIGLPIYEEIQNMYLGLFGFS